MRFLDGRWLFMIDAGMTRKEFLKMGALGISVLLIGGLLRFFGEKDERAETEEREASYYRNLAG
jgi:hypothetical protein